MREIEKYPDSVNEVLPCLHAAVISTTADTPPPTTLTFQGPRPSALQIEAILSPNKDLFLLVALPVINTELS